MYFITIFIVFWFLIMLFNWMLMWLFCKKNRSHCHNWVEFEQTIQINLSKNLIQLIHFWPRHAWWRQKVILWLWSETKTGTQNVVNTKKDFEFDFKRWSTMSVSDLLPLTLASKGLINPPSLSRRPWVCIVLVSILHNSFRLFCGLRVL